MHPAMCTRREVCPRRDKLLENDLFHDGKFTDSSFAFRNGCEKNIQKVFVHSGLVSTFSPVFQKLLEIPEHDVDLHPSITYTGFKEVLRYCYELPRHVTPDVLEEVIVAAQLLQLDEITDLLFSWGIRSLLTLATTLEEQGKEAVAALRPAWEPEDALGCLFQFATFFPQHPKAKKWREVTLRAFPVAETLQCLGRSKLPPDVVMDLVTSEVLHEDEYALWCALIMWARTLHHADSADPGSPQQCNKLHSGRVAPVSLGLFGKAARLRRALEVQAPNRDDVEWQEPLLGIADYINFDAMGAVQFASSVERLDPMLPQLRQVIYSVRRSGAKRLDPILPLAAIN